MFDFDKWQEIIETIRRHKLRTGLTAFGVFWGIFMLVLLLGAGNGLQNGVEYDFRDDAINSIWMRQGKTSIPYKGMKPGRQIQFDQQDFDAINATVEGIEHSTPRNYIRGDYSVVYNNKGFSFNVRCTYPGHRYVENTEVHKGRFLNDKDISEGRKVAAIGSLVAETMYEEGIDPLGTYIQIKGIPFKVIGIFTDSGGPNEMKNIYLPWSTANQAFNHQNKVHQMMVTTGDLPIEVTEKMTSQIEQLLADRHKFSIEDKQAIHVFNNNERFQSILDLFTGIRALVAFVGFGTLLAGIIGVGNIMLIIVSERTKEIGLRKALGATPNSIISMILMESIFITSIAGYLGLLCGVGLLELMNLAIGPKGVNMFKQPEIDISLALIATIILVVFGGLAGYIPAQKAAAINPIDALREE
ncbi:MAG: ABC transporter permease [Chitinophagales bacterium]